HSVRDDQAYHGQRTSRRNPPEAVVLLLPLLAGAGALPLLQWNEALGERRLLGQALLLVLSGLQLWLAYPWGSGGGAWSKTRSGSTVTRSIHTEAAGALPSARHPYTPLPTSPPPAFASRIVVISERRAPRCATILWKPPTNHDHVN